MNFYILCLFLFNFIAEFGYVVGQVSEECKIFNFLKNLPDTDCCVQQNVCSGKNVCDENGYVQCLDLTNSSLTVIPEEIGYLIHLKYLYLGENNIQSVPEFILNLKELQTLGLNNNNFNEVPEVITKLHNLKSLLLSYNHITELPPSIGNAKSLEYLGIQHNQLSSLPKEIENLSSILNINALGNVITYVPDEIGKLKSLTRLYLYNNQIETIPSSIGNLNQLELLSLGKNNFLKSIPPEIFNLGNLKSFGINLCPNLDIKVINFRNVVDECYFYNTNISCYEPGTCKTIRMDGDNINANVTITESEFLKNNKICTEKDIISVKQGITNSGFNTLVYICIIAGLIIIIIIAVSIWYINYYKRKINKNFKKNVMDKSSDVIIYEKHQATPETLATLASLTASEEPIVPKTPETQAAPATQVANVASTLPTSTIAPAMPIAPAIPITPASPVAPTSTTLPSSSIPPTTNINIILPLNVLPTLSYMPTQPSEPLISYEQLMAEKIQNHVELNMSNNIEYNKSEKQLLDNNNVDELPSPPYSRY